MRLLTRDRAACAVLRLCIDDADERLRAMHPGSPLHAHWQAVRSVLVRQLAEITEETRP